MTNKVQEGQIIEYSNAGSAIASGDVVVLGDRVGVAISDIAATTGKGSVSLVGVYSLDADNANAFAVGDQLYWDGSELTQTPDDNTYVGMCVEAKVEAGTTAKVLLQPHPKKAAFVANASAGDAAEINALRDAMIEAGIMSAS
jgi:predicted RecA/RadA family phage recombinase